MNLRDLMLFGILPHFTIGGSIHHAGQELIWATAACGQHLDGPQATFFLLRVVKEEGSDLIGPCPVLRLLSDCCHGRLW